MNKKDTIVTVKENERKKIYRLNRRLDALNELLTTIDNTKIKFSDPVKMKDSIIRDIADCKVRIEKWWNIIGRKYNLPNDEQFTVLFRTGEIVKE